MPIPAPATAARRAAALFVSRFGLTPPVDVEQLLRERATLHRVDWPHETVDAILLKLGDRSPEAYVRATDNLLRERFTVAHELGHLILPWHFPRAACAIGTGALDLEKYSIEDEADVFASCLLLPDAWLLSLLQENPSMSDVLQELNTAEVTTMAALRALRRVLLSGWVFIAFREVLATPGTWVEGLRGASLRDLTQTLEAECYESGESLVNGYSVRWYRLFAPSELPPHDPEDDRTRHQQLVDAVSLTSADEDERIWLTQVVNGKIGGILREASGRPAIETFAALKYRFEISDVSFLLEQPGFDTWLADKARDIESGVTKSKKQSRK